MGPTKYLGNLVAFLGPCIRKYINSIFNVKLKIFTLMWASDFVDTKLGPQDGKRVENHSSRVSCNVSFCPLFI